MYVWTQTSIRFRMDAAAYTRYDEEIARHIAPRLTEGAHLCDAGCGLGYLSLALAKCCGRVTAVDTSGAALAVLRGGIERLGVENVDVVEGNLFSMRPMEPYDAMAFCFFGRVEETLRAAKAQCRGTVYLVKKTWGHHRFTFDRVPLAGYTLQHTVLELEARGVPFTQETFPIEMGQPFRSLEDASLFFETYRQDEDGEAITPERVRNLLRASGSERFPYFLPSSQTLSLITIDVCDIPDRFGSTAEDIGASSDSR